MKRTLIILILLFSTVIISAQDELIGPDEYPEGINPLTGLEVDNPALLERRPLMVKIINAPAEVRPQSGLMNADIVWETLIAGGVTRFAAFYYSQDPDYIGPIRSARLSDFEILRIYRAFLVYSGMSQGTLEIFLNDDFLIPRAWGGTSPCPALCRFPETASKLEWTLYGDTSAMREVILEKGKDLTYEPIYGMAFSETVPENGIPAKSITLNYAETTATWEYDEADNVWLRSQDGEAHIENLTDEQISASNVLIIEEDHTEQPFVAEGYWGPGNFAFSVNFIGKGRAILFRDGQYFEGEWRRESQDDVLFYFDAEDNTLPFKPGNTFVQLVPRWVSGYDLIFDADSAQTVTVTAASANLRVGPGSTFGARDGARRNDEFRAIGRNNSGTWVQIIKDDLHLWVAAEVVTLNGDVMDLPLVRPTVEN